MAGPQLTGSGGGAPVPPILGYHKVDTRLELGFTQVEPRVFRRQVERLAAAGCRALGSRELLERLAAPAAPGSSAGPRWPAAGAALPEAVVFTFDDGYAALARHAFPVLVAHGFKALVFVVSDYVGRENSWDVQYGWRRFAHLDWDTLAAWQERGIEVHSHGATHARLTWLADRQIAEELERSRESIAARLGRVPAAVSYPYGAADARVRGLAARAGYELGFLGPGRARPGGVRRDGTAPDPLALPRRVVYAWDRFRVPLVLGTSVLSRPGLALARFANRCAVGTAVIQRALGRRYRA